MEVAMNSIQRDPYINGITPPVFSLALMRIDTAFTALSDGMFQSDCEWFKQHSKRSLLIRRESHGEFDPEIVPQTHPAFNVCLAKPLLWVLVMRIMPGTHLCIPVYRGQAFWHEASGEYPKANTYIPAVSSDEEIGNLLIEMQRLQGIDGQAFKDWFCRYVQAMQPTQQPPTATELVN
jgi:hypothetical protein